MLVVAGACASFPETPSEEQRWPTPARGMVVSQHPLATAAGVSMLEAGGNAADAAVACALALAVVYPKAGNLGGGGFALWSPHEASADPQVLDFREVAPETLRPELFLDAEGRAVAERSIEAPLGVGVPGTPMGLWLFQAKLGRLPFVDVVAPAIALARGGFPVDAILAEELRDPVLRERLCRAGMARAVFYPGGDPLEEGELLRQEVLAETLELYATRGPEGFYRGDVASAIVGALVPEGGHMTMRDLARYQAKWRTPLRGWFRGYEVVTVPPPSSGGLALLQVLAILDGFPLDDELLRTRARAAELDSTSELARAGVSGRAVHWWIEAMRRAFADRAIHLGDPEFHDVPLERLMSPEWIAERRISIGEFADPGVTAWVPAAAGRDAPAPDGVTVPPESEETTHLCALDRDGNAVSLTTTLNTKFGSGLMVRGGGFLLNNEIDDFAIQSGVPNHYGLVGGSANALAPGKRPLSSMTPTVLRAGGQRVHLVLGAPGGPKIITAVLQVVLRTVVYGESLEAAVAAPRLHQQWSPAPTRFEEGWDPLFLQDLRNRGHGVEVLDETFAAVQAIQVGPDGEPIGVSDPRRGGAAMAEQL